MLDRHIGFIGLGAMGGALAERLLQSGATLHVHDVDPQAVARFVAAGAHACDSPRAVADSVELAIGCLPNGHVSKAVALGENGIVHGARVKTYVECSTIGRATVMAMAEGLAAKGIALIDAPVSGGPKGARAGTLSVIASGPREAVAVALPVLAAFGPKQFVVGEQAGMAQMMKLVNNLVSAANMASAFEAVVLGAKAGLDPDVMVEVLNGSTGRNTATETKLPQSVLTRSFDYGAKVDVIYKDVHLALAEAEALGVPMWVGQNTGQMWRHAVSQGAGAQDYTVLIRFMEQWAGVEVKGKGVRP
ncbi:NAD(P)-dependent oxidoreductase [Pigmentiphaga soli]|uniref:NAD(P)-dependent oxidoreductase n=1 Tax=Pigmentiphaga soli TaxID=1007095 RepID=A0ABP8HJE5_9BURK